LSGSRSDRWLLVQMMNQRLRSGVEPGNGPGAGIGLLDQRIKSPIEPLSLAGLGIETARINPDRAHPERGASM